MPALPQFDYLFAFATIFAFLDAWNIGTFSQFIMSEDHPAIPHESRTLFNHTKRLSDVSSLDI